MYSYTKLQDKNNYSTSFKNVYGGQSSEGFLVDHHLLLKCTLHEQRNTKHSFFLGHLFSTPLNNLNLIQFPVRARVMGSRLYSQQRGSQILSWFSGGLYLGRI